MHRWATSRPSGGSKPPEGGTNEGGNWPFFYKNSIFGHLRRPGGFGRGGSTFLSVRGRIPPSPPWPRMPPSYTWAGNTFGLTFPLVVLVSQRTPIFFCVFKHPKQLLFWRTLHSSRSLDNFFTPLSRRRKCRFMPTLSSSPRWAHL